MHRILQLTRKEFRLELRQKHALGGLALYVIATVYIAYLSFQSIVSVSTWNALFWIIMVFAAFNALNRSFLKDGDQRKLYLYTLASPRDILWSKAIFNTVVLLALGLLNFLVFALFLGTEAAPHSRWWMFVGGLVLGSIGLSAILTLIAGIASQTQNSLGLTAVLGLPVLMPFILVMIRFSKNALDGIAWAVNWKYGFSLFMIAVLVLALASVLFPYLWRD